MAQFLILATLLIAILGLFADRLPKRYKSTALIVTFILLVVSTGTQFALDMRQARNEAVAAVSGTLRSSSASSARFPVLMLCDVPIQMKAPPVRSALTFIEDPVYLRMEGGEAKVSLVVRDHAGMIRAYIRDNVWFVPRSEGVFDRNYSSDALEVVGPRGEVFLQVKIEGEKVRLVTTGYSPKGEGPSALAPCPGTRRAMFKYPSTEFLGEFEDGR